MVLISHDRHIIETCVDRLWLVHGGTVKAFDGDMDEYTDLVLGRQKAVRKVEKIVEAVAAPKIPRMSAQDLKKKTQELDIKIMKSKDQLKVLDQVLADHTIYVEEPKKAADYGKLRAKIAKQVDDLETQWLELSEAVAHG